MDTVQTPQPAQVEEQDMATPVEAPLVAGHDRCDRCGAQAFVKTRHHLGRHPDEGPETVDLLWCKHHYDRHHTMLSQFVVLDEREKLNVRVVSSY